MNPANNHENWIPLKPSDTEENIVPAHTIDCPFYSVVPTSSSENDPIETPQQEEPLLSFPDEEIPIAEETDSAPQQLNNSLDAAAILDSELNKVSTVDEFSQESSTPLEISPNSTSNTSEDSAIEDPQQMAINAEFNQLLQLNQELRAANDDFYAQIEGLTEALRDSQAELQRQKKRADVTESMLTQQNQELIAAQSQIESLVQQLDQSQQNAQREEALLETYRAHLDTCQQKLAQLERECASLKSTYNEQSQQLAQSETACRELRTRLMRQQRQTLQFKAALEKCLESPLPGSDINNDGERIANLNPIPSPSHVDENTSSLLNNTKPIEPWSSELDETQHLPLKPYCQVSPWQSSETEENHEPVVNSSDLHPEELPSSTLPEEASGQSIRQNNLEEEETNTNIPTATESTNSTAFQSASASTFEQQIENLINQPRSNQSLESLEAQIDSVIQMFFTSSETDNSSKSAGNSQQFQGTSSETSNMQSEGEFETLSPWDTPPTTETSQPINTITVDVNGNITSGIDSDQLQQNTSPTVSEPSPQLEQEDVWADMTDLTPEEIALLNSPAISDMDDDKSPSPVVYPHRSPKGRKSWSSVELPNFRPPQQS